MSKQYVKIVVAFALIGVAGVGALVASKDASADAAPGGGGGGAGTTATGGASLSPAQIRIAQVQGQKRTAEARLAQATAEQQVAEDQVRLAGSRVYAIDLAVSQQRQRVAYAQAQLGAARNAYYQARNYQSHVAGNLASMGVDAPDIAGPAHGRIMEGIQGVSGAQFAAQQEIQSLAVQRCQAVVGVQNAQVALENARRQVGVAQDEVAAVERQLALLMAQVTP